MTRKKNIIILCIAIAAIVCIFTIIFLLTNQPGSDPTNKKPEPSVSGNPTTTQTVPSTSGNQTLPSAPNSSTAPTVSTAATSPSVPAGSTTATADTTTPTTQPTVPATEPTTQPTVPTTQTTVPGTQSANPTTKPTDPTTKPTTSGTKPTQSTTKPTTQVTQTTTSSVKLKINTQRNTVVMAGDTLQLDYTYTGKKTLTWSSMQPDRGTVDQNGFVTTYAIDHSGPVFIMVTDGVRESSIAIYVELMDIHTTSDLVISAGETFQIDYTFLGDATKLSWSSSDSSVFTIDNNGLITGVGTGYAIASASTQYDKWSVYISVIASDEKTTHFDMQMDCPLYDGVTKFVGHYLHINATHAHCMDANNQRSDRIDTWSVTNKKTDPSKPNPENPDRNYYITSSNPNVVSVVNQYYCGSYDDYLYFNKAGTSIVTITSWDGYSESYKVHVKADYACAPDKDKLTPGEFAYYAMMVGVEDGLKAGYKVNSYLYIWYDEDELTWETAKSLGHSNAKREFGLGTGNSVIVYAGFDESRGKHLFYHGMGESGTLEPYTPPSSSTGKIRFANKSITMTEQTAKLEEVLGDTSEEFVIYTSSDPNIVDTSGGLLLARYEGTATITATYKDQAVTMTVTVKRDPTIQRLHLHDETITLHTWSVSGRKLGYNYFYPCELTWTSSDQSIAHVTEDGHVYPGKPGQCVITVTDGVNTDTCIVTVID